MGADPVAFVTAGVAATRGRPLKAFSVRKEAKDHGGGGRIAGALDPGDKVVVDRGHGDPRHLAPRSRPRRADAGAEVVLLVAVVDRGGTVEAMAAAEGLPFRASSPPPISAFPTRGLISRARSRPMRARDPSTYHRCMAILEGEYEPSPSEWVRDQVAEYEASGGTRANTLLDTGMPIIVVTSRGAKSGHLRKNPVMKVEHDGATPWWRPRGVPPSTPSWFHNLVAHPDDVTIQDGPEPFAVTVRQIEGDERAQWWERSVAAYPPYAEYQEKTDRRIPVFLASRADAGS